VYNNKLNRINLFVPYNLRKQDLINSFLTSQLFFQEGCTMRKMKTSLMVMALVAVLCSLSLAAPVTDSVQITGVNGAKVYVLVTQNVIDSLRQAGNLNAAFQVMDLLRANEKQTADSLAAVNKAVDDSLAAVQQTIDDSLATIEERKNFWPNVQRLVAEIPEDFDAMLEWADTPVKVSAVLLSYDVPRSWIEQRGIGIDVYYGQDMIILADISYAQTRNMLHRYAVELNGPAHRRLMGQDSVLISSKADQACLEETNASLAETREAVELTFKVATVNTENIQTLASAMDDLKRDVWTCLEGLKRTKIRKDQGDDNRRMMDNLSIQGKTAVVSTELKSTEL